MGKTVYTLKEKKNTGEFHLFEGEMTGDTTCSSNQTSICKEMDRSESSRNVFACKAENAARIKCAEIGRTVCGTCVSHLYATY